MPISVHSCELGIGSIFTVYGPIRAQTLFTGLVYANGNIFYLSLGTDTEGNLLF